MTNLFPGYSQPKQSIGSYNVVPTIVKSVIILLLLAALFLPDGCYPSPPSAPVDASAEYIE